MSGSTLVTTPDGVGPCTLRLPAGTSTPIAAGDAAASCCFSVSTTSDSARLSFSSLTVSSLRNAWNAVAKCQSHFTAGSTKKLAMMPMMRKTSFSNASSAPTTTHPSVEITKVVNACSRSFLGNSAASLLRRFAYRYHSTIAVAGCSS
jgi:hypothetical protein